MCLVDKCYRKEVMMEIKLCIDLCKGKREQ